MKTLPIDDTGATWNPVLVTWTDGEIFRETRTDVVSEDISEHLGYLKEQEALSAKLAGDQVFTGNNEFVTSAGNGFEISGDQNVILSGAVGLVGTFATFTGALNSSDTAIGMNAARLTTTGKLCLASIETMSDAAGTISAIVSNIPTLTANRIYSLQAGGGDNGRIAIVRRSGTAAFTATLNDDLGNTMGIIPASQAGWIVCIFRTTDARWVPILWSGNVTSILGLV